MAVVQKIEAQIGADDKQFRSKLKETEKRTNEFTKSVQKMGAALAAAFAVNTIKNFLQESIKLADIQLKAEASLLTALKGKEDAQQRLIKQAKDLQKITLFGDEETIRAQALLAQLGMTEDQITKLMPKIQDMATGLQMDLVSAASAVGKTVTSSTNALARHGIEIQATGTAAQKTGQLMDQLTEKFEGQAEVAAKTGTGAIKQFNMALDDIKEEIAFRLLPVLTELAKTTNEVLPDAFDKLAKVVDDIGESFKRSFKFGGDGVAFLEKVVNILNKTVQITKIQWIGLTTALGLFGSQVVNVFNGVKDTFSALIDVFKNVNDALLALASRDFGALGKAIDNSKASILNLGSTVKGAGSEFVNNFSDAGKRMGEALVDSFNVIFNKEKEKVVEDLGVAGDKSGEMFVERFGNKVKKGVNDLSLFENAFVAFERNTQQAAIDYDALANSIIESSSQMTESLGEDYATIIKGQRESIEALARMKDQAQMMGEAVGTAFGQAASGQISFQQALIQSTGQIVTQYLRQALAAAIAREAIKGLVGIATATAAVAAFSAMFRGLGAKGGVSMGGGGGRSMPSVSSPTRTADTRNVNQTPVNITGNFRMQGKDLVAVIEKTDYSNSRVRG